MSSTINIISIIIHLSALLLIWKTWQWKAFIHPGFYFSAIWLMSVVSEWYLLKIGFAKIPFPIFIDELNVYASFTSLCFICFSLWGYRTHCNRNVEINIANKIGNLKILIYIIFFVTIMQFLLSGSGLSFGENRMAYVKDMTHISQQASGLDAIFSIIKSPLYIISILMGICCARKITHQPSITKNIFLIALPFIITFIGALMIGGRNPIIIVIKQYLLGVGLGMPIWCSKKIKRKLLSYIFIVFVLFSLFATYVNEDRRTIAQWDRSVEYNSPFSGVMEYLSAHYWGYQLRRTDFSTGDDLKYGVCTFYGIGAISIPLSGFLGINGNLWDAIGVDYDPLEVYKSETEGSYTTSSIYDLLVRDFGALGTYGAIIFIVLITQYIFLKTIRTTTYTAISLIPLILVFNYWASSNFNSGFMSLQSLLIGAIIFDLSQNNYSKCHY